MTVFVLQHLHQLPTGDKEIKFIGVYSSVKLAEADSQRLSLQPGFSETSEGFSIASYEVDKDHGTQGYVTIE